MGKSGHTPLEAEQVLLQGSHVGFKKRCQCSFPSVGISSIKTELKLCRASAVVTIYACALVCLCHAGHHQNTS